MMALTLSHMGSVLLRAIQHPKCSSCERLKNDFVMFTLSPALCGLLSTGSSFLRWSLNVPHVGHSRSSMCVQTNASPSISSLIFSWKMSGLLHNPIGIAWHSCLRNGSATVHSCLEAGFKQMWWQPMLRSRLVDHWNPSGFNSMSWMFGIGYDFCNILSLSSQKSEMNLTDPSFSGMMKVGAGHSEQLNFFSAPVLTRRSTSAFGACVWHRGMLWAREWHGFAPSLSSSLTSWSCQRPSCPSNSGSHLQSSTSSWPFCSTVDSVWLWQTVLRSAFLCLTLRILFTRETASSMTSPSAVWQASFGVALPSLNGNSLPSHSATLSVNLRSILRKQMSLPIVMSHLPRALATCRFHSVKRSSCNSGMVNCALTFWLVHISPPGAVHTVLELLDFSSLSLFTNFPGHKRFGTSIV